MNNDEESPVSPGMAAALGTQCNAALRALSNTHDRRAAAARFFLSVSTGLVTLLALTESPVLTAELRQDMANFVAVLSLFVSVIWFLTVHSLRPLAQEQRTVIMEMERSTPFDFMTRLTRLQEREAGWLQSGRIEAIVPLAMTVPALTMLYLINAN